MKRYRVGKCLVAAVLFYFSCVGVGGASEETGCVSAQCHSSMTNGQNVHPAGKGCVTCHLQKNVDHLAQEKDAFELQKFGVCIECHAVEERVETHPPVAAEDCLICHNPHGNMEEKLLRQVGIKLCLNCHRDLVEQDAAVIHGPIASGSCIACHEPHGADYDKLFPKNYSLKLFCMKLKLLYRSAGHRRKTASMEISSQIVSLSDLIGHQDVPVTHEETSLVNNRVCPVRAGTQLHHGLPGHLKFPGMGRHHGQFPPLTVTIQIAVCIYDHSRTDGSGIVSLHASVPVKAFPTPV